MATTGRSNVLSHRGTPGMVSSKSPEEIPYSRGEVRRLKRKYSSKFKEWERTKHAQIKKRSIDLKSQKKQVSRSAKSKIRAHHLDIERAYRQQGKWRLGDLARGILWKGRPKALPPPEEEDNGFYTSIPASRSLPIPTSLRPSTRPQITGPSFSTDRAQEEPQQRSIVPTESPYGVRSGPQYALPAPPQRARFAIAGDYTPRRPALPAPSPQYAVVRPVSRPALTGPPSPITRPDRLLPAPAPSAVRTIAPITRPDRLLPAPSSVSRPLLTSPFQRPAPDFDTMKRVGPGVPGAWNPITRPDRLLPAAGQTTRTSSNAYLRLDNLKKRLRGAKAKTTKKTT